MLAFDYDKEALTSTFNKENYNNTNRTSESNIFNASKPYQNINNDFTSISSVDTSNYNRSIQPIRYKDPSSK